MTKRIINNPSKINDNLIKIIDRTKINYYFIKNQKDFRDKILSHISTSDSVLDVGRAMREKFSKIKCQNLETLDINNFGNYPDILCDICDDNLEELDGKYDKIICIAVLEHVYNPFKAVKNLKNMLKENGVLYGYVPYLYHYHAPKNLEFQDYFRFSKDALSYLFKDFKEVELYPIRGRISTPLNLMFSGRWKKYIEKTKINILLDKLASDDKNSKQCSGFYFILKK